MEFITGRSRNQIVLLPDSIEEYVGEDNAVRVIGAYINGLDLEGLKFSRPQPRSTRRPGYDPKDLLKLYVYGYLNRVRSSRRPGAETKRKVEVMWLMGKLSPDHKNIALFRPENAAALKRVFRDFVGLCVKPGLYGKELAATGGSKSGAVNSRERNFTVEKLREWIARLEGQMEEYLKELDGNGGKEEGAGCGEKSAGEIKRIAGELSERKARYKSYEEEPGGKGETQKSLTGGESRLMAANGKMDVCYNVQTAVDAKNKLVAEFEVTNAGTDYNQLTPMAGRTRRALGTERLTIVADAGYDSARDIGLNLTHRISGGKNLLGKL